MDCNKFDNEKRGHVVFKKGIDYRKSNNICKKYKNALLKWKMPSKEILFCELKQEIP